MFECFFTNLIAQQQFIFIVWVNDNEFTGTLPTEIGAMDKIQIILAANNKFTGTFPPEWKQLKNICKCVLP